MLTLPSKKELRQLYWEQGLATREIAKKFGTHQRAIIVLMKKYGISRRDRISAVIKGAKKYDKPPFSGDLHEKAYLLGLTLADLRRRKHGYQVDLSVGSTHPAFIDLFCSSFEKYSHVRKRACFNQTRKRGAWSVEVQLHPSFNFLLGPKEVPDWVICDDLIFLHFLAGYNDGEGCICIAKSDNTYVSFIISIASCDKEILEAIFIKLQDLGFHPSLVRNRKAGDANILNGRVLTYKKDKWCVRLKRKDEVLRLLQLLPMRHSEKIRKRALMFELKNLCKIQDLMPRWKQLVNEIKNEVEQSMHQADTVLASRLNSSTNSLAR